MTVGGLVRLVRRRTWVVVLATLAGVALAVVADAATHTAEYRAEGTYVVRTGAEDENDQARAAANLSNAGKINATYAEIAESDLILGQARDRLGEARADAPFDVDASVELGANILTIAVDAANAELAYDAAVAVGDETVAYILALEDLYSLTSLDAPQVPTDPVRRGFPIVPAVLGAPAGFVAGVVVALGLERQRRTRPNRDLDEVTDPVLTASRYLRMRLREEIARADATGDGFTLATVHVGPRVDLDSFDDLEDAATSARRAPERSRVARALAPTLRAYDVVLDLHETVPRSLVALIPGRDRDEAEALVEQWRAIIAERFGAAGGDGRLAPITIASCRYEARDFRGDAEAMDLAASLSDMATATEVTPA